MNKYLRGSRARLSRGGSRGRSRFASLREKSYVPWQEGSGINLHGKSYSLSDNKIDNFIININTTYILF